MSRIIRLSLFTLFLLVGWIETFAQGPGGYFGFGIHFGLNKTIGAQVSYGIAVSSVGEPGSGPYLFPGVAFGIRRSLSH